MRNEYAQQIINLLLTDGDGNPQEVISNLVVRAIAFIFSSAIEKRAKKYQHTIKTVLVEHDGLYTRE